MSDKNEPMGNPVEVVMDLFAKLYIYMAKEVYDKFGEEGKDIIEKALINFGHDRGKTIRKKHEKLGFPITVKSLFENYDLPADKERVRRNSIKLTDYVRYSRTLNCPWQETWREIAPDHPEMWRLYCDTVHQAVFEAYIDDITCELPQLLTKDDAYCQFEVYRKGHKSDITGEET